MKGVNLTQISDRPGLKYIYNAWNVWSPLWPSLVWNSIDFLLSRSVWCRSTVNIDSFICYGEIRAGMCRTEYLIDWNSLEHSWLRYNHHKMSWDSNIYSPMVNLRQMSSFIHVCVVSIKFFLDSYLNKIFKGYFVVLQNICKNALGLPY